MCWRTRGEVGAYTLTTMSDRKRVNISIDPKTYEKLKSLQKAYGFDNVCEMVVALAHILLDRMEETNNRKYDLPDPDGAYIDEMFDELSHVERTPDGTVPVRHNNPTDGKR